MNERRAEIMKKALIFVIAAFVAIFGFNCEDDSNPLFDLSQPETRTPEDSAAFYEALVMSLWYTDNLYPDSSIAWRFYDNLLELREKYADSIPEVEIKFVPIYSLLSFYISVDSTGFLKLRNGTFSELDSINDLYGIVNVDTSAFAIPRFTVRLDAGYPINTWKILPEYEPLDGITWASVAIAPGDWSNIYPWIYRDKVTFLVRSIEPSCPVGCPGGDFYYFMETDSGMAYIGFYRDIGPQSEPAPEWWNYGRTAYYIYMGYTIWRP
jgi:hypothetical protein